MTEISVTEAILEYIALRKKIFFETKKRVPKQDKPFLEAYVRELEIVERFVSAVHRGDVHEVSRLMASTKAWLDIPQEKFIL